jgi:hypothetical protein
VKIRISIDELALYGFNSHDGNRIIEATKEELALTVRRNGLPCNLAGKHSLPQLFVESFDQRNNTSNQALGKKVADLMYQSMKASSHST